MSMKRLSNGNRSSSTHTGLRMSTMTEPPFGYVTRCNQVCFILSTGGDMRRSYGQYCGLARALDVVGDRWNLLLVRELLVGPMRYGELVASLGGIATNLLP